MIFIILGLIGIVILYSVIQVLMKKNANKKIINLLKNNGYMIEEGMKPYYDIKAIKDDKISFIKVIYNFKKNEINVNSKKYFQLNSGVVSSRKKGKKLEKVYDLIEMKVNDTEEKIYLVYPSSSRLLKVLNECEMQFIDENTDIYGTKMIEFVKAGEYFEKR